MRDKNAPIPAEEGRGNSYDFGARILDPRVGLFLSLDPLMSSFPWQSPYVFAGNDPIRFIDTDEGSYIGQSGVLINRIVNHFKMVVN